MAEVHDGDAIRDVFHHRQVVGDEQIGESTIALEILQQVHHLRLHADVQRADRLVADDEARFHGQGARNANALALAAGKFVRVAAGILRAQADLVEQLLHARIGRGTLGQVMNGQSFTHDGADGHAWVERRERVLKHDLHFAAKAAQISGAECEDVGAVEVDSACGRLKEAQDRAARGGLAAARLAHECERFASGDVEGYAVHGPKLATHIAEHALLDWKVLLEIANGEQGFGCGHDAGAPACAASGVCGCARRSGSTAR